jgi:hypothetical protein
MKRFTTFIREKVEIPKSGNLGFKRKEMPQIEGKNIPKFLDYLKSNGVKFIETSVESKSLKPTQNQFNQDKIQGMIDTIDQKKQNPIMVSKDGYVLDGHHRWLAHYNLGRKMPIIRIDLKVDDALDKMHDFPLSIKRGLAEDYDFRLTETGDVCPIVTREHMKAFEAFVDRMFAKFNIDFDFTKHFRERMSDERNRPCIDMKELAGMIQKIYKRKENGKDIIAKHKDAEIVVKDMQTDLNMPVAIEYDSKDDEFRVVAKTIMRKKNFTTPNPTERL